MTLAIDARDVGKRYTVGQQRGYDTFRDMVSRLVRRERETDSKQIWALSDVSFTVDVGDTVGIVGRNGAGKSTLLKILSRITAPTKGTIDIDGRIGSLLEVGTGFHPELSGRENIYLNGAILGMSRHEITKRFEEIVEFAEISKFLDTPVKRYSSGMYMRLAFSVAAHLETEILVVDEVLAVGDAAFQRKCLGKMSTVAKTGRTVLFVSHNMAAVGQLCRKGLLLREGKLVLAAPMDDVLAEYAATAIADSSEEVSFPERPESLATFTRACFKNAEGKKATQFTNAETLSLEIEYVATGSLSDDHIFIALDRSDGLLVFKTSDDDTDEGRAEAAKPRGPGRYVRTFEIPLATLNEGVYSFRLVLGKRRAQALDERTTSHFEVEDVRDYTESAMGKRQGVVLVTLRWTERQL